MNSLFFELTRQWKGILIEPIFFDLVKSKRRKAYALNACIAKRKPFIAKFLIGGSLSGNNQAKFFRVYSYKNNNNSSSHSN